MSKISELSDGGVIQGGDTLIAVRSGGNVKVTYGGSTTANIDGGTIDGTVIGGTTPAAGTFTTLTANGNVVLGDAATDTVTVTADIASDLIPSADGSFDLGASGAEWQDLFIDGTANIDSLVADTADINAGTIDGTVIGGSTAAAGTFTTLTASGDVTFSGGTANGVAFANGSKVLTTGSALTFDGTNIALKVSNGTQGFVLGVGSEAMVGSDASTYYYGTGWGGAPAVNFQFGSVGTTYQRWLAGGSERMRLTSTGLGIGTSSPAAQLHVQNSGGNSVSILGQFGTGTRAEVTAASNEVVFKAYNGTNDVMTFYTGASERMRIDSSGRVGIGTSSPVASLDVVAGADDRLLVTNSSGDTLLSSVNAANTAYNGLALNGSEVKLFTNASERARINASGALKQSLDGNYLDASGNYSEFNVNTANSYGLIVSSTNASPASTYVQDIRFRNASPNNTSAKFLACNDSTEEKAAISSNGDFTSRTNSYGGYSDIKLKENVVDASEKLTDIMQLKVRNFNFKNDPDLKQIGFIAQEFEQIFPALVTESPDRDQQGNISTETTKSIKTSVLIPILVKAMQEQQAIIESLTARIEALEGAN